MHRLVLLLSSTLVAASHAEPGMIRIHPNQVEGELSPLIYGQFLEHIYDSVVDGLDGQLLRGPSFEEPPGNLGGGWEVVQGTWSFEGGELVSENSGPDSHALLGDPNWTDFDFSFKARKESGSEGFLVLFRATSNDSFYWWNLGGWGNTYSAVEHEVNGQRTQVPGTNRPIIIETGRWYEIKITGDARKIRCYLDNTKVLEFDDETNCHGRVGLGTWATGARFTDFRVHNGDKNLLAARPGAAVDGVSRFWKPVSGGDGVRFERTSENPLNSRFCQKVLVKDQWGGVSQDEIPIEHGRTYKGSVWARGKAHPLSVSLEFEGRNLNRAFEVDCEDWKEFTFEFSPDLSSASATFSVLTSPGEVWLDQCTLRRADTPYRPVIFEKVKEIRPAFIRWPGGCYAEYYRWRDGIGPMEDRVTKPNTIWGGLDPNHFGTDEYIRLCRDVDAEPLIVLNIGHHDPPEKASEYLQEALNWLEYCNGDSATKWGALRAANGHPEPFNVRYWEIGNETWPMGVEAYAARVKMFVEALRGRDSSLKILVCGSGGHNLEWNRGILQLAAPYMDYLSVHHYMQGTFEEEMRNGVEYPAFLTETGKWIRESANPDIQIAVTEWNEQSVSLRAGLYAGLVLNGFERLSNLVTMSCPALFIRKTTYTEWNNAFINHDSHRAFVAPNYLVMKLYRDHFAPIRVRCEGPESLNILASKRLTGEVVLKVVNPSATREVQACIELDGGKKVDGFHSWRVESPGVDDRNSLDAPERIRVEETTIIGEAITFPAHSVTVVEGRF